jgi:hypothetical protein
VVTGASPLSPVVKSIVTDSEPAAAHVRGRVGLMRRIESRFRFLAVWLSADHHMSHLEYTSLRTCRAIELSVAQKSCKRAPPLLRPRRTPMQC